MRTVGVVHITAIVDDGDCDPLQTLQIEQHIEIDEVSAGGAVEVEATCETRPSSFLDDGEVGASRTVAEVYTPRSLAQDVAVDILSQFERKTEEVERLGHMLRLPGGILGVITVLI
jgi:hypothetical protein